MAKKSKQEEIQPIQLPENAYRELEAGEEYVPIIKAEQKIPEVTARSVIIGLIMAVIFSGAAAFLGLKTGNVFEAAIPIAILAVGISYILPRKSTILENVMIQSIGASSGAVVAGAIFTLPAIFILKAKYPEMTVNFMHIFMASLLGGILGIVFLILFRKYFVSDMHGKFPFPEGTATTEVLVSGESGGSQAKTLVISMLVSGVYDFCVHSLQLWKETLSSRFMPGGELLAQKAKMVFGVNITAAIMGMGYIVGLKYASIICAGSFLAWFVIVPLLGTYGSADILAMTPENIFFSHVRYIGIGGIAAAGLIGIIKSSGIIWQAFTLGFREMFKPKEEKTGSAEIKRTDRDMKMPLVFGIIGAAVIAIFIFFLTGVLAGMQNALTIAAIALIVVLVISFLFTTVAARAIAIVGTNPVSGMTLMTLIISSLVLVTVGLKGTSGMVASLIIGGVVCTALSMAGAFITDLKIGYWIGSTPKNQEQYKFLGTLVSAFTVAFVIIMLNNSYGFVKIPGSMIEPLAAPQANSMAAVIETFMSNSPVPWMLYGTGAVLALILELIGIPALAFMLGVFIPIELNIPILIGGLIAHIISKSHKDPEVAKQRKDKGTLIASGFIAGGAIMGVIDAVMKNFGVNLSTGAILSPASNLVSVIAYAAIIAFMYWFATKKDAEPQKPNLKKRRS